MNEETGKSANKGDIMRGSTVGWGILIILAVVLVGHNLGILGIYWLGSAAFGVAIVYLGFRLVWAIIHRLER